MKKLLHFFACIYLILTAYMIGRAQKPEMNVQTGHSSYINSVAFSPDGKTLLTASGDIKLWEVASGIELRTINRYNFSSSVLFTPGGKTIATVIVSNTIQSQNKNSIKLWDVVTGRELRTIEEPFVSSIALSPDGKTLAIVIGMDGSLLKLRDAITGAELRTIKVPYLTLLAFSPDGKTLACISSNRTIRLLDVHTGAELRTLKGHADTIKSIAFSPDGKVLATGGYDGTIKMWNALTGAELRTIKEPSRANSTVFSPDGKTLAVGVGEKYIKFWDVTTGAELRMIREPSGVVSIAFSPDGKVLASGSYDNTIKLWNAATGAELRSFKGHSSRVSLVAFSPDGKTIASSNGDNTTKLWDIATGAEMRTLEERFINSLAFSPDGKTLATVSRAKTIKLWDIRTGAELRTLKTSSDGISSVAFSLDGKTLVAVNKPIIIWLWDVATGNELRTIYLKRRPSGANPVPLELYSVKLSPDAKTLATVTVTDIPDGFNYSIKLWDVVTGYELITLKTDSDQISSIAFSPDGKTIASGADDTIAKLMDVSTGKELHILRGHSSAVSSVAFSPDGKMLASGSIDNTIKLWDVSTGSELKTLRGHSGGVFSVSFSPNNRQLVSGSRDASIKVWEFNSGSELASIIALDKNDWVVTTPDGLFDGSPAAWNKIIWRFNNNTFNYALAEAFFGDFYYPGLLSDIFMGKHPRAPLNISQKDRRQPQLKISFSIPQTSASITTRNVRVKVEISKAPAGARDVRLFRNGSLVKVWHGDVLNGRRNITLEAAIPIVAGENRLTAYAFNRDNIKSSDVTLVINGSESLQRPGIAYILAVGINSYSNPQYNLKYAVADATAFSAEVKRQLETLKNYAQVKVISLADNEATKASFIQRLEELAKQVQPEDSVIVYFAGHGTAQQNKFYLIPHDLGYTGDRRKLNQTGLQAILAHSVSDKELEQAFGKIDARQILLVIDACNSGQALEAEERRRGPMNSKGLAQLAYEKGMYILTAAQSYQAAKEATRLGHGYLTYALVVEGLNNGAADDAPKDNKVFIREWFDYATARVPQMQLEKLKETRARGEYFSFVEGDERDISPENQEVQRPRVFYRREVETNQMIIASVQASLPTK